MGFQIARFAYRLSAARLNCYLSDVNGLEWLPVEPSQLCVNDDNPH